MTQVDKTIFGWSIFYVLIDDIVLIWHRSSGLKDNIIQNLVEQDRYDEARTQCEKWQLVLEIRKVIHKIKRGLHQILAIDRRTEKYCCWSEYRNKLAQRWRQMLLLKRLHWDEGNQRRSETYKDEEYSYVWLTWQWVQAKKVH